MKAPTNTAKEAEDNPFSARMGALNIEAQVAQGQRDIVHSDTLPTQFRDRGALERAGVIFGDPVPGDPLFCFCTLPNGWKKVATDYSMWSKLIDDKGRERAAIFYKAAFYDRKAHADTLRRFSIERDYEREDASVYMVKDCNSAPEGLARASGGKRRVSYGGRGVAERNTILIGKTLRRTGIKNGGFEEK